MHYYQFHIGDFRGATAHLSNAEELAYRRLLDWYYDSESPIPLDTKHMARRMRVGVNDLESVLNDFFVQTPEGWVHKRCENEIAGYRGVVEKNRENGRKGGRPRKNKDLENPVGSQSEPTGNPLETQKKPNQEPITNNQEPRTNNQVDQEPLPADREPKAKRKARIPDQFIVNKAMQAWAAESAPRVDLRSETENFCDYWRGRGDTKADWVATWRNWMRKAQVDAERGGHRNGYKPFNKAADVEASNAAVVEEIARRQAERTGVAPAGIHGDLLADDSGVLTIEGDFFHAT